MLKRFMRADLQAIADHIEAIGECPAQPDAVESGLGGKLDTIFAADTGATWFAITSRYIWFVRNIGGDAERVANVWMGGRSGIGHRVPYDMALADQIRELDHKLTQEII